MRKKLIATTILSAFLCTFSHAPAALAADNVQVTLPSFTVTLNGQVIDNSYRQYPLLVYKDITYFPMTYYDCRFLGVETDWTNDNGLRIQVSDLVGAYHQQNRKQKNKRQNIAQLATGDITVNGKIIHNNQEEYPLLSYRDVTYFPLTWRFAVNEFGWKYSFDGKSGLNISASNPKTTTVTLTDGRKTNNNFLRDDFQFTIDNNYLYYQGAQGAIYRRPLSDLSKDALRQKAGEFPACQTAQGKEYPAAAFYEQSGKIFASFERGYGLNDKRCYRLENNTLSKNLLLHQNDQYVDFGNFQANISHQPLDNSGASKLQLLTADGVRSFGIDGYWYALDTEGELPYDKKNNTLYLSKKKSETANLIDNGIVAVNLTSGTITPLNATGLSGALPGEYDYDNGMIYYQENGSWNDKASRYIYTLHALDPATNQNVIIAHTLESFTGTRNGVYYVDKDTNKLTFWNRYTYQKETINDKGYCLSVENQNGYAIACFDNGSQNPYLLMVFAPSGQGMKQLYASADVCDQAFVNKNGMLVYRLRGEDFATSSQFVTVQLPKIS